MMDSRVASDEAQEGMRALELASATDRLWAWLIDHVIMLGIFLAIWIAAMLVLGAVVERDADEFSGGWQFVGVLFLAAMIGAIGVLMWYVYLVYLVATRGQTPGKRVFKIRIIKDAGGKVGWGAALVREFVGKIILVAVLEGVLALLVSSISDLVAVYIWIFVLLVLFIWIVLDEKNQTLHDKIAGTYVVRV